MSYNEEGYVVVDANWDRIKVKSPTYIAAHYMKNNGQVSLKGLLQYYRAGDLDEFVTYAPEYAPVVTKLYKLLNALKEELRMTMTDGMTTSTIPPNDILKNSRSTGSSKLLKRVGILSQTVDKRRRSVLSQKVDKLGFLYYNDFKES